MSAQDNISQELFDKHKKRANRIGKSIKVRGVWITPDKGVEAKRNADVKKWHDSLKPLKETLSNANIAWSTFRTHIRENASSLGAPRGKDSGARWARDLHDKNPKEFLKNIGL